MKRFNQAMTGLYVRVTTGWSAFKRSDRGDTNFISIMIILAIVVVLGGAFILVSNGVMESLSEKVSDFIGELSGADPSEIVTTP